MATSEFNWIRHSFFPRWDRQGNWRVSTRRSPGYEVDLDLCDWETKMIHVLPEHTGEQLYLVLIHEICHAVVPHSVMHGATWQKRMLMAADRAREVGEWQLAELVEGDVQAWAHVSN